MIARAESVWILYLTFIFYHLTVILSQFFLKINRIANMDTTPTFNEVGVLYSQKYFKEELQMSNSSTSPVQYPLPYKVINGCLFVEKANKNGTTTRKLCNFLPYLTNEVEVDDGVEQTRYHFVLQAFTKAEDCCRRSRSL